MLRYHPAHDPHHAAFRFLRLLMARRDGAMHAQALRILDFFLLFPAQLETIRMPANLRRFKIAFRAYANKYFSNVSKHSVFHQMHDPQTAALQALVSRELLIPDRLAKDEAVLVTSHLPTMLRARVEQRNESEATLIDFLVNEIGSLPLLGDNGLKDRTGLVEYRYDSD